MTMSPEGRALIKHHEGVRLKPYLDPVLLWTVGVGHLIAPEEQQRMTLAERKNLRRIGWLSCPREWDRTLTDAEVDSILEDDLARFERGVLRLCPRNLTQSRFDALVSFAFNTGLGTLQRSSIRAAHNRGEFDRAADAFLKYRLSAGQVLPGLVRRRQDERALYLR